MHIRYYLIFVTLIKHTIKKALEVVCMLELFIDKQKFKKHKIRDLVFFFRNQNVTSVCYNCLILKNT